MRLLLLTVLTLCLVGVPVLTEAQTSPADRSAQQAGQTLPSPPSTQRVPAAPRQSMAEKVVGQPVNIRVELLLTDRMDAKIISEERLNVLLADRELGRVRRRNGPPAGQTPTATAINTNRVFEVDLTPEIVGEKVKVAITINYMAPAGPNGEDEKSTIALSENVTAFLESEKPTTIVEAMGDPGTNRRVLVQATATILK